MQSQDPDSFKNLLMAAVLSVLVIFGWQYFVAGPQLKEQQERAAREKLAAEEAAKAGGTGSMPQSAVPGSPSAVAPAAAVKTVAATRAEALKRSPRIAIETPSLKGSIALKGGLVDDLVLPKYRETVDPASPAVVLLSPPDGPDAYFAKYGWLNAGNGQPKLPDSETLWTAGSGTSLTPTTPVTLTWDNGAGLVFKRTLSIDDSYMLKVVEEVENKGSSEIVLRPFALLYRLGTPKISNIGILHEGLIGVADAGVNWCGTLSASTYCELGYSAALEDSERKFDSAAGWLGITDKYWAAVLVPDQKTKFTASFQGNKANGGQKEFYTADYLSEPVTIPAGETRKISGNLFAGAKQVKVIEGYETSHGIAKFNLLIDWGWFEFITRPFNHLIIWLYGILGNFGLAILLVTVLVKLAFFPLANKSYVSMAKMKKLQPQMEQLRERFKDDKARQQQELMALYQKEKINPLAGCLPILVQIPVFFALYKVLFVSIDMRHAPFVGWIQDLSAADPTSLFNLFGLLPFAVPEFLHIGVWPIIMGITMWIQMQLNPPQPDPVQQAMFAWMPVIFTFLLGTFPAGLVIYWAWSNILSIAQQWYISHKQGVEIHLMDNVRRTFGPLLSLFRKPVPAGAAATANAATVRDKVPAPAEAEPAHAAVIEHLGRRPATKDDGLQLLGLKPGASHRQIIDAYNRLAKELHPAKGSDKGDEAQANLSLAKELALGKKGSASR